MLENETSMTSNSTTLARVIVDDSKLYGNFCNGDIPLRIVKHAPYTRIQRALGLNSGINLPTSLYFKVEFQQRSNGVVP